MISVYLMTSAFIIGWIGVIVSNYYFNKMLSIIGIKSIRLHIFSFVVNIISLLIMLYMQWYAFIIIGYLTTMYCVYLYWRIVDKLSKEEDE